MAHTKVIVVLFTTCKGCSGMVGFVTLESAVAIKGKLACLPSTDMRNTDAAAVVFLSHNLVWNCVSIATTSVPYCCALLPVSYKYSILIKEQQKQKKW